MTEKRYLLQSGYSNLHENFFDLLPASHQISLLKGRLDKGFTDTEYSSKDECCSEAECYSESEYFLGDDSTLQTNDLASNGKMERTAETHSPMNWDVYYDKSFAQYRLTPSPKIPRAKLNLLIRNCVSTMVAKCGKTMNREPTKLEFEELGKQIVSYYPSVPKDVGRKLIKRHFNANANAKKAQKEE